MSEAGINDAMTAAGNAMQIPGACPYCSGPFNAVLHGGACPRVKRIEYHPSGGVKSVELHPPVPVSSSLGSDQRRKR